MLSLNTKQIYITPPTPPTIAPPPPPVIGVQFVKPLSYEFRVAETVKDGTITKVSLQMQIYEHDEFGTGTIKTFWHDVNRVRVDENGNIIL